MTLRVDLRDALVLALSLKVQTICLGALCSACSAPVCVDDKCSLCSTQCCSWMMRDCEKSAIAPLRFYKLRFCRACARQAPLQHALGSRLTLSCKHEPIYKTVCQCACVVCPSNLQILIAGSAIAWTWRQAEGSFPPEVAEGLSKDLRKILPAEAATRKGAAASGVAGVFEKPCL